ncbi:hypothetical protein EJB05_03168 [Eragrostis curvula]|uniref:TPX2 C-terminal domain-containing protein n=1 Tax=Eragrostis curvula TaxID=38414 RepID=A0A5J9WVG7_9POAL|nr:hypothetical protein EJB05_03168 [Eragrostis curvula]
MGAETDLSPPPVPEPALSPEPDVGGHDNQGWKADMMSALGESVSFGRFLAEPLDWGKWSAFAHNRYLEEAARQARPGSVAQKKALFEAHYARKRKSEEAAADDQVGYEEEDLAEPDGGGVEGASLSSSAAGSSCMTDDAATGQEQEVCGGGGDFAAVECGGGGGDELAGVAEEVEAITDGVGSACKMDEAVNEPCHVEPDAQAQDGATHSQEGVCNDNSEPAEAVQKQPLKEISIVNQDITDSAKKRRLQMPSLLQKPSKFSSPSSGKKGQSSSAKRRSALHSSKENTSPQSTDSSKRAANSVTKKRSTLAALHMSMRFSRCETGNAASTSRNLGTTIAERISQLQSASRPVENTQLEEFRPQRKTIPRALPEFAPRTAQVDEQRPSHVMRVKEKLFGSTSPSVTQKPGITKEKERKLNNEAGFKESRQSFCFKARPLPNFCRKNKQAKDSNQQTAQEIQNLPTSDRLPGDVNHAHQMGKGVSKEKQICCFPIRKLY